MPGSLGEAFYATCAVVVQRERDGGHALAGGLARGAHCPAVDDVQAAVVATVDAGDHQVKLVVLGKDGVRESWWVAQAWPLGPPFAVCPSAHTLSRGP